VTRGAALLLFGLELVLALGTAYLLFLTLAALWLWLTRPALRPSARALRQPGRANPLPIPVSAAPPTRFEVLVPAHDDELLITRTLNSLLTVDYPRDQFRVHVIADNCTDATADLARAAGAIVHERTDTAQRGKGYALRWLFRQLLADPRAGDAFVIVDADSVVNPGFLRAMDGHLTRGAVAVQGYDTVLNTAASWGTALRYVAFALLHYLRPLGRRIFGGSAGLKGNGMAFRREVLAAMDWDALSVTEDLQFHLDLLLAGHVVTWAPDAVVWAEMPATMKAAHAQNVRWETGRLFLLQHYVPRLLGEALRRRSFIFLDAAMENLVPPFSIMAAGGVACLIGALLWGAPWPIALAAFIVVGQVIYTITGLVLVRAPGRVYLALVYAPFYVVWKLLLWLNLTLHKRGRPTEWIRTARAPGVEPGGNAPKGL
jgi:cellulose synthase/poly-beta-1,6-N-acetylglucosamine synthase-like glycosyltransferase